MNMPTEVHKYAADFFFRLSLHAIIDIIQMISGLQALGIPAAVYE